MKIYFAGSIRGGRQDAQLYMDIITLIQNMGHSVLTEHVGLRDLTSMGEDGRSENWIYERDMAWLKESECVVAEVTQASLGVGYEIAKAEELGKPVLCLYRPSPSSSLSAMIAGSPSITNVEYHDAAEAEKAIKNFIADLG